MDDLQLKKSPPSNIEAEQFVLGAVLYESKALKIASALICADDFYKESHRKIFTVMQELMEDGKEIDLVTMTDKLRSLGMIESTGGAIYLSTSPAWYQPQRYKISRAVVVKSQHSESSSTWRKTH
jgi:replicative DNA helicase